MAIKYFPNRTQIASRHAIEKNLESPKKNFRIGEDTTSAGLNSVFSPDVKRDWKITSVGFSFNSATSRDYSFGIQNGRKVVSKYNDFLWIQTTNSYWQKITLDEGFYTGTQLAAELQNKLDANENFDDLGITFTVTYNNTTGVFSITPSSTQIKYIQEYRGFIASDQVSIGGHLFGLNENTAFANSVSSDSPVSGLDDEALIISQTASSALSHYHDDVHELTIDQAISIKTSTAATEVTVIANYQEM